MAETQGNRRQPDLYWRQLEQLKAASICMRLYRNRLAKWVTAVDFDKFFASSGSIVTWAVWKEYPMLWAAIIGAAQFLDVVKMVFPFTKRHKAASDLTIALELLYIDAEEEWENIYVGKIDAEAIIDRRTKLRKLQIEAERRYFPDGFEPSPKLIRLAEEETRTYFRLTYSQEG